MSGTIEIEKTNLEAHVELCAQRYDSLENRLDSIEKKVSTLQETLEKSNKATVQILIGTAGTVLVGLMSAVAIILTKLP
jgi:tetrahydromethanopterin S-methyltransferase subunit G